MIDCRHGYDRLLRIAGLFGRSAALPGDDGFSALVIEGRHVHGIGSGALRRAGAGGIRGPGDDATSTFADGRKRSPLAHTRKATVAASREQLSFQLRKRFGADTVNLGESHACAFV